jgi:hypothetical protein
LCGTPVATAGLAYALFCEQLGRQADKQPGDSVSLEELTKLSSQAKQLTNFNVRAISLAGTLERVAAEGLGSEVFVLPDLLTALTSGFGSGPGAATDVVQAGLAAAAAGAAGNAAARGQKAQQRMGQLLMCSCWMPQSHTGRPSLCTPIGSRGLDSHSAKVGSMHVSLRQHTLMLGLYAAQRMV